MSHSRSGSHSGSVLHPHSTTMGSSGASLPNLRGGFLGAHDNLCFDPSEFAAKKKTKSSSASGGGQEAADAPADKFDAHLFVTRALAATNPAFQAQQLAQQQRAAAAGRLTANNEGSEFDSPDEGLMPTHSASPSVPLDLLRDHLTSYQLYIKNELIELLNNEYQDFIGLSSSLTGIDTRIGAIQAALAQLSTELASLQRAISVDTLEPFTRTLVQSYFAERAKQSTLHALMHVLEQMRANDAALKENENEEKGTSNSDKKENEEAAFLSPVHARIIAHHRSIATAPSPQQQQQRHPQRGAGGRRTRTRRSSDRAASASSSSSYDGLKIDIPLWMVQSQGGDDDEEDDDDDESAGEDDEANEEGEEEKYAPIAGRAPSSAASLSSSSSDAALDRNVAFGLYQALLNVPTTEATYRRAITTADVTATTTAAAVPPAGAHQGSGDSLAALTSTLLRLERVAHSYCSLSQLARSNSTAAPSSSSSSSSSSGGVGGLSHFHLIRDLRSADGLTGPLDLIEKRLKSQARQAAVQVMQLVAESFEDGAVVPPSPAASVSSPQLLGLVRTTLRLFVFLDARGQLEDLVRERLILPALQRLAPPEKIKQPIQDEAAYWRAKEEGAPPPAAATAGGNTAAVVRTTTPLREVYANLLAFVRGPLRILSEAARQHYPLVLRDDDDRHSNNSSSNIGATLHPLPYSFLSTAFFPAFVEYTCSSSSSVAISPALFAAGIPHVFLEHYRETKRFLQQLTRIEREEQEEEAASADGALAPPSSLLHAHPSWCAFQKKWNLTIYFQLRFQQIATQLETAIIGKGTQGKEAAQILAELAAAAASAPSTGGVSDLPAAPSSSSSALTDFALLASYSHVLRVPFLRVLYASTIACFHPHTFLSDVGARFLKLALQCVARGLTATEDLVQQAMKEATAGNTNGQTGGGAAAGLFLLLHADWSRLVFLVREFLLPLASQKLVAPGDDANAAVAISVGQVHAALQAVEDAKGKSTGGGGGGDDDLLRAVASAFAPSLHRMSSLLASLHAHIVDLLLVRCKEPLLCVPRIAGAYRGTKRKMPVSAFGYVRATLAPLVHFVQASDAADVDQLVREAHQDQQRREVEANEWMAADTHSSASAASSPSGSSLLQSAARDDLIAAVLTRLTADFDARAKDCLADVVRLEELSKKLGKRPTAGGAAAGAAAGGAAGVERNDAEKTRAQLDLDVTRYALLIREQLAMPAADQMLQPLMQTTRV